PLVGNVRHGVRILGDGGGEPREQLCLVGKRAVTADPVDGAVAGGGHDPAARVRRQTGARPALERGLEGVLQRVLREAEVAGGTGERRHRATPLLAEDPVYRVDRRRSYCPDGAPAGIGASGRISIEPPCATDGILPAHSIASSSDSTSI